MAIVLHSYKMPAQLLDGKYTAATIRQELSGEIDSLRKLGVIPALAVVLVGEDPASAQYVRSKRRACERVGIAVRDISLPDTVSEEELLSHVTTLNSDASVHGVLVQLPLPAHITTDVVIESIRPEKDVDGIHPVNVGRLVQGRPSLVPCTPAGIVELLLRAELELSGQDVVIVGRSNLVGKPLAALISQKSDRGNATVTLCHSGTRDLARHTGAADIVVAAAGSPEMVTGDMVKPGAVVVDVGITRVDDPQNERGYRLVGDVDFESVSDRAAFVSPVPGGVGPMTVAMLLNNTLRAARWSTENG